MKLYSTGDLVTKSTISGSGDPDIAEQIPVDDQSIDKGDIIVATDPSQLSNSRSYDNVLATKTTNPYQKAILGVVSTNPTILIGEENAMELGMDQRVINGNRRAMVLAGRIPTKVSTINGPIRAGDPITSSSIPGVGVES